MGNDTGFLEHSKKTFQDVQLLREFRIFVNTMYTTPSPKFEYKPPAVWTVVSLSVTTVVR